MHAREQCQQYGTGGADGAGGAGGSGGFEDEDEDELEDEDEARAARAAGRVGRGPGQRSGGGGSGSGGERAGGSGNGGVATGTVSGAGGGVAVGVQLPSGATQVQQQAQQQAQQALENARTLQPFRANGKGCVLAADVPKYASNPVGAFPVVLAASKCTIIVEAGASMDQVEALMLQMSAECAQDPANPHAPVAAYAQYVNHADQRSVAVISTSTRDCSLALDASLKNTCCNRSKHAEACSAQE